MQGDNIVLISNHQTEADPAVIALLLESTNPTIAENMVNCFAYLSIYSILAHCNCIKIRIQNSWHDQIPIIVLQIYVAGDRVVTDPLCKPFSMGRFS